MDKMELNMNEMEQVDAGCIWCIAAVAVIGAIGYGLGRLSVHQAKNGK
jgi:hypothetical protein